MTPNFASSNDVLDVSLPLPENKLYYPALDGLRAVSLGLVFAAHYMNGLLPKWLHWGWAGVDIFFVLSGFLITGILYDTRNAEHRFQNFYVRRTLRIFPLYYGIPVAILLSLPLFAWTYPMYWRGWLLYIGNFLRYFNLDAFFTSNNPMEVLFVALRGSHTKFQINLGHFWSLCIEEQFYLLWPSVVYFVRNRKTLVYICTIAIVVTPMLRYLAITQLPARWDAADFVYRFTLFRIDTLLMGSLLALLIRGPSREAVLNKASQLLIVSCGFLVLAWGISTVFFHESVEPWGQLWVRTIGYTLLGFMASAIVLITIQPGNLLYRALNLRWLRGIGAVSYGAYIFHDMFHGFYRYSFDRLFPDAKHGVQLGTAFIAIVGTGILSYLSFRFFERPFLRLKDRFTVRT